MNCAKHSDVPAAAYCRTCGKALCETCKRDVRGVVYCEDCLASRVQSAPPHPPTAPVPGGGPHPAVAGVLAGFFPFGVGQAYNGQYARGFIYLVIFIALIWACANGGSAAWVFGISLGAFIVWQIVDAVRSARFIQMGLAAPDPFGFDRIFGGSGTPIPRVAAGSAAPAAGTPTSAPDPTSNVALPGSVSQGKCCPESHSSVPLGALILVAIGVLLLLGNIGILHVHWVGEFWPVILIVIGGWLLAKRWQDIVLGTHSGRRMLMGPAILLVLGVTFLLDSIGRVAFHRTWPLILIVIGVVLFWQRSATPSPVTMPPASGPPGEPPQATGTVEQQER